MKWISLGLTIGGVITAVVAAFDGNAKAAVIGIAIAFIGFWFKPSGKEE